MMPEIKCCRRCGKEISNVYIADYYSHIRILYCPACKKQVSREQAAQRMSELRKRRRVKNQYRDEQLELLKEENALLRKSILKLRSGGGTDGT